MLAWVTLTFSAGTSNLCWPLGVNHHKSWWILNQCFLNRSDVAVRSGQLFKFIIINPTISHIRITAQVLDRIWQTQCHKASIRDDSETNPFLIPVPGKHWGCSTLHGWQGLPLWRCHLHLWMYLVYHHPGPMYITIVYLSHSWIWWANIPYLYHIHTIVIPCNSICHIIIHMMYLVGGFNPSEKYESQLGWSFPIYGKS